MLVGNGNAQARRVIIKLQISAFGFGITFEDVIEQLVANLHKIQHIPAVIVHGRYDVICPLENAYRLHKGLPKSELVIVPGAGHSAFAPGISHALVRATDEMLKRS